MNYKFLITIKKSVKIAAIFLLGILIAGLEVKYPQIMGLEIFNK